MHALYFRGRQRVAARQVLDHTSIGQALADDLVDDGDLLTLDVPHEVYWRLSSGERTLYGVLASLAGVTRGETSTLYDVVNGLDTQTAWCVWWALGVMLDRVVPMPPVDFDGLADVVRRP